MVHICCVSGCFKSLWRIVYEERDGTEQSLKFMAPNHISSNWLIYREKNQHKKKKEALLYHVISSKNICWHPNSALRCWDPDLLTKYIFLEITKRNMRKILLKIDSPYLKLLKNRSFFGYSSPLKVYIFSPPCNILETYHCIPWVIRFPCISKHL